MVAVEARSRVREQSELAETGRFADGIHCSIFLVHLGVSYAQHKLVSRRLWLPKAAHRAGLFQMVLLVGCVAAICICQTGAGRVANVACESLWDTMPRTTTGVRRRKGVVFVP